MILLLRPDGEIIALAHPERDLPLLEGLGRVVEVRRAGRVLPAPPARRAAFRLLRGLLGWSRAVREWTRRWPGPWIVRLPDGSILGPFREREEALQAEEQAVLAMLLVALPGREDRHGSDPDRPG